MRKVISTEKVPIKLWLDAPDENSLNQVKNLANLPFAFSHVCLMPDAHAGYGMPIGGVLAADNVIVPNAVGVDIGCGMCAVKTDIKAGSLPQAKLRHILDEIRKLIPLGFDHHKEEQNEELMPQNFDIDEMKIVKQEYLSALKQLGTLGGGNHFIEIQNDEQNYIWIMIHSGSRNIGLKVAEYYNNKAKKLNALWHTAVSPKADLAFLPFESDEARMYYNEMKYCVAFAFANRNLMMERIQSVLSDNVSHIVFDPLINIAHNYAAWEEHFGKKVVVHRKGATSARQGETGIIPGSQGTRSYIVVGLGNHDSFMSCSHGAGRIMSRSQAIKNLDLEEEIRKLDKQGIIHSIKSKKDLDEASSAYKDIQTVIQSQNDLVTIKHILTPLGVIKG
ncbi:MAG TPA: RtcB family protein [Bacteroidales bacterium]|nr:RtcB family protein [Bacteroidales bacterium]